jgi:hypothetical protein
MKGRERKRKETMKLGKDQRTVIIRKESNIREGEEESNAQIGK